ncbi:MAG: sulfatase-like hydrolase/transferase [Planctomycetota bacterium]
MNAGTVLRRSTFVVCWAVAACLWGGLAHAAPVRPNILWITCEDISPNLGCYGDSQAVTPNLDRLAQEGVRYTAAFSAASVCSPARSCLITGVYPTSLGTQHLRSTLRIPDAIRCFPEYLRRAGYYCSNNVKEDYNFQTPPESWDESSPRAHWRKRKPGQPFFSVFNLTATHQGQIRLEADAFAKRTARLEPHERHDPANVPLPPYYPDTPVVRRDVANLYDLITAMDKQAGDLLGQLEADGLAGDTIVFFYSDHGTGLPRHKRWLYDSGIRVPLIIRFPEKLRRWAPAEPGAAIDRLVSFVDFAPTVLSLAGLEIPDYMEGRAFLGDQAARPREHVFAVRDRVDEVYEVSRAVRDKRFKYIRHYLPHRPMMQHSDYSEQTPTRKEFRRLAAEDQLAGPPKAFMSPTKPTEELYDTQSDPHEIHNLAGSPDHQDILKRMRDVHRNWVLETHDTGLLQEAEMYFRSEGLPPYEMTRNAARFPQTRILEAADLVGRGVAARDKLIAMLADPDSAVRYWAVVGLTVLGPAGEPAVESLMRLLGDPAPNVRLAAAEALSKLDREAQALPVIVEGLKHEEGWVRLHAAIVLVAIGEKARAAVPKMKTAAADARKHQATLYIRWALQHALDNLGQP